MKKSVISSDALIILTAAIWGFAFVPQRVGMDYVGPFIFTGIRFGLGALSLVPFWYLRRKKALLTEKTDLYRYLKDGVVLGILLFLGASLQQIGLVYTTAGKAGFITGLYVILVPIFGLVLKQRAGKGSWLGAILVLPGLYFLSVTENWTISLGDLLVLGSAFFWAFHVILVGHLSPKRDPFILSIIQFSVCSLISLGASLLVEKTALSSLKSASWAIAYGGFISVGIAYTIQVVTQRKVPPAHAAIVFSLEGVFAALSGWLVLHETLTPRNLLGCGIMLSAMLVSQLSVIQARKRTALAPN